MQERQVSAPGLLFPRIHAESLEQPVFGNSWGPADWKADWLFQKLHSGFELRRLFLRDDCLLARNDKRNGLLLQRRLQAKVLLDSGFGFGAVSDPVQRELLQGNPLRNFLQPIPNPIDFTDLGRTPLQGDRIWLLRKPAAKTNGLLRPSPGEEYRPEWPLEADNWVSDLPLRETEFAIGRLGHEIGVFVELLIGEADHFVWQLHQEPGR